MDRRGTMSGSRSENVNAPSELLKDHENREVFELIGKRCTTLCTAVVQLYMALPSSRDRWSKKFVGVVTLAKDNAKKTYFIRLIDLVSRAMVWEQELYNHFVYSAARPYFHVFEADTCNVALNFASQKEADQFRSRVAEKLRSREQRKLERKNQQTRRAPAPPSDRNALRPINGNQGDAPPRSPSPAPQSGQNYTKQPAEKKKSGGNKKDKNKKGKLSKADIGLPSDFRHVGHVGWDPAGGFDVNNIDPKWKKLFDSAGITEKELEDQDTSQFIYDFVEKHGGIDKATEEMESLNREAQNSGAPPPPSRGAHRRGRDNVPPPSPPSRGTAPPPPPSRRTQPQPPPPTRGGPPPPPGRNVPAPPGRGSAGGGPPPPPPPPPMGGPPPPMGGPPPPPPPASRNAMEQAPPSGNSGRGDLLSAIHGGATLKKVDQDEKRRSTSDDGRGGLLAAIRAGKNLKTASAEDRAPEPDEETGMAGALMKALQDRQKHIQSSDEETDGSWSGEESWSD